MSFIKRYIFFKKKHERGRSIAPSKKRAQNIKKSNTHKQQNEGRL